MKIKSDRRTPKPARNPKSRGPNHPHCRANTPPQPATPAAAPRLPTAPRSIQQGSTLQTLLDRDAIDCLAHNLSLAHDAFDGDRFRQAALDGLEPLGILERGLHLARALRAHLPPRYKDAIEILLRSLTPPLGRTDDLGLAVFFYLPHVSFVAAYGLDPSHNEGIDPFETSMGAQYELTKRFSAEFSMRPFLIHWPARTLERLQQWTCDPDPHVRRLCSEGARPRPATSSYQRQRRLDKPPSTTSDWPVM